MASSSPATKVKAAPSKPSDAIETVPDPQTDYWGTIMTDKGQHDVRMQDDTGTRVNWIHPDLAKRLKLEVESLSSSDTRGFLNFSGKPVTAKQAVRFTWSGQNNKTYFEQFYIAPAKSDVDVVLGKAFVDKHGRDKEVCNHRRRKDTVRWLGDKKETKKEKQEIAANQLQNERDAKEAEEAMRKSRKNDRGGKFGKGDRDSAANQDESRAQKKHGSQ